MRGCVAAGMASCLHYLGLADSFDAVYGASAGSLVGMFCPVSCRQTSLLYQGLHISKPLFTVKAGQLPVVPLFYSPGLL